MKSPVTCTLLAAALLCGCATRSALPPLRDGSTVALQVLAGPETRAPIAIRNLAVGEGVTAGVTTGVVVGSLWGLACGPFFFVCMPIGAAAGSGVGALTGAAVGVTGVMANDPAARLRERITRASQAHDLVGELRQRVEERAQRHWTLASPAADGSTALVGIELQSLRLATTRDDRVSLEMHVQVTVTTGAGSTPRQKDYAYVGPLTPLAVWLDERSDLLDTSLSTACQQIASQIVGELSIAP
jgi:hypothetical protein